MPRPVSANLPGARAAEAARAMTNDDVFQISNLLQRIVADIATF
jgi:hypothetical protein